MVHVDGVTQLWELQWIKICSVEMQQPAVLFMCFKWRHYTSKSWREAWECEKSQGRSSRRLRTTVSAHQAVFPLLPSSVSLPPACFITTSPLFSLRSSAVISHPSLSVCLPFFSHISVSTAVSSQRCTCSLISSFLFIDLMLIGFQNTNRDQRSSRDHWQNLK